MANNLKFIRTGTIKVTEWDTTTRKRVSDTIKYFIHIGEVSIRYWTKKTVY